MGFACHPYQPLVAMALPNSVMLYSLPHYATGIICKIYFVININPLTNVQLVPNI